MSDLAKRLRDCAATMRTYKAASIDAFELDRAADEIDRLRDENEWLKAQLPSSPEAAAAGGGFDPYNP